MTDQTNQVKKKKKKDLGGNAKKKKSNECKVQSHQMAGLQVNLWSGSGGNETQVRQMMVKQGKTKKCKQ